MPLPTAASSGNALLCALVGYLVAPFPNLPRGCGTALAVTSVVRLQADGWLNIKEKE